MDYYTNGIQEIREVFNEYLDKCTNKIIYCAEDPETKKLCLNRGNVISYGFGKDNDIWGEINEVRESSTDFTVTF